MLISILSIIVNVLFFIVLNKDIYTDRAPMPDGGFREWHRSPITRLNIMGNRFLLYLQLTCMAVSVISGILVLFGVKNSTVKTVQLVSSAASAVVFMIIMIVTSNSHVNYA